MTYENEHDELIDLGTASVETKGGDQIGVDEQALRKHSGLSND